MIQQMGRLFQQVITTLVFSAALAWASPWLVLLLALGVLPSFLGETHYAFLGYAKNFRQTTAKRTMDYPSPGRRKPRRAKEVKLFGLNKYFTDRFQTIANQIYREDVALSRSKLIVGGLLGIIGTLGYYGAYVYVIWRTLQGGYNIASLPSLPPPSSRPARIYSRSSRPPPASPIRHSFLPTCSPFFEMEPTVRSKPDGLPAPKTIPAASSSVMSHSPIRGPNARC